MSDRHDSHADGQDLEGVLAMGELADDTASVRPRRRRLVIAFVTASALILAGGGVGAWAWTDHTSWVAQTEDYAAEITAAEDRAATSATEARSEHTNAIEALATARESGAEVLAATEDQVADDALRTELAEAIAAAEELEAAEVELVTEPLVVDGLERESVFAAGSRPEEVFDIATGTSPTVSDLEAATTSLEEATETALGSQSSWARDRLASQLENSRDRLSDSEDEVEDNDVRVQLQRAIESAQELADDDGSSTEDLIAARASLREAHVAVTDAQEAWQDEQERQAQAAAAAAARSTSSGSGSSSSNNSGSSGSSSTGSSSSGSTGSSSSGSSSGSGSGGSSGGSGTGSGGSSSSGGSGGSSGGSGSGGSSSGSSGGSGGGITVGEVQGILSGYGPLGDCGGNYVGSTGSDGAAQFHSFGSRYSGHGFQVAAGSDGLVYAYAC